MRRWLGLCLAAYAPHLLEEALTRMHDDPLIVAAFEPLSHLSPRHATYLVFQIMFTLLLSATLVFSLGGRPQRVLMALIAFAMLSEAHHVIRALASFQYNSGLVTSLPMPVVGALVLRRVFS
jgi:hypothetical protein